MMKLVVGGKWLQRRTVRIRDENHKGENTMKCKNCLNETDSTSALCWECVSQATIPHKTRLVFLGDDSPWGRFTNYSFKENITYYFQYE